MSELVTLYRPVGQQELDLIRETGRFPPRLPSQPFFYPVLTEEYARQIAREWNAPYEGVGYVLRFAVNTAHINNYAIHRVGSSEHEEYWIPAIELAVFNDHIVGPIEVIATYRDACTD